MADDAPKLIVDDDWKSTAQKEKQRLAEEAAKRQAAAGDGPTGAAGPGRELPKDRLVFDDLVRMLAMQALQYLGAFPDQSGRAMVALDVAKAQIDLLGVVEEKTKGNLDEAEAATLDETLRELRAQFVHVSKAVAQAQAEGKLGETGAAPGPAVDPGTLNAGLRRPGGA